LDELLQIQSFVGVMEAGGFRAAARQLGLSASAVSKRVRALEERLGARLLQRTTRRVVPTEGGQAFYERAREILADLREAETALTEHQQEARGTLRVAAPMDFGRRHLAQPLADFASRHPQLVLDVDLSDRFVDVVGEGFDVAIRIGALEDSGLVARRIAPCRRLLVAAPRYLRQRGTPGDPAELPGHDFIGYALETSRTWRLAGETGGRRMPLGERHRANNGEMVRALAVAGLGIALLPTFLTCDALRNGELQAVLPDQLDADIAIHAVYPHRRHLSAKVRLFVEHLVGCFGPEPDWDRQPDTANG
jgi:DNA-binding transcriptional LysR family regulator